MKVTIKDVAKEANVSPATVSRVLGNSREISDKTKSLVREVIKKLKYTPNAMARSLISKKTRILGIIIPSETKDLFLNSFFMEIMQGMNLCAQSNDYYITYVFSEDENAEQKYLVDLIDSKLVDGVCLLRVRLNDKCIKYLKEIDFPFTVIGRPKQLENILWVDNDNFQATYNLTDELIRKNHKNIAFLGAKESLSVTSDRIRGFKAACDLYGITLQDKNITIVKDFNEEEGIRGTIKLLENNNPTAIIVEDDVLAFGTLKVFKERNINDVEVIGFNNNPLGKFQKPQLSSIDTNPRELGYYAVKILIDFLEKGKIQQNNYIIKSKLIRRETYK